MKLDKWDGLLLDFPEEKAGAPPRPPSRWSSAPTELHSQGERDWWAETEKQKERERTEGREKEERRAHVGGRGDSAGLRRKADGEASELGKGATLASYPQFKFIKHLLNNYPSLPSENRRLSLPLWLTA